MAMKSEGLAMVWILHEDGVIPCPCLPPFLFPPQTIMFPHMLWVVSIFQNCPARGPGWAWIIYLQGLEKQEHT